MRQRLLRLASSLVHRHAVPLPSGFRPTVSFTFDDFPVSAAAWAAPALEGAGMRGTWYLAAGLMGQETPVGRVVSLEEARGVREAGHEIGCHTRSHLLAADVGGRRFGADIAANRAALAGLWPERDGVSFSFPYGDFTPSTKAAAAGQSASCRTTQAVIARGSVDLNALPANPMYEGSFPLAGALDLVRQVESGGGWLVFYTHDVADRPSPWGCTPAYFSALVAAVAEAGLSVRPVGEVVAALLRDRAPGRSGPAVG